MFAVFGASLIVHGHLFQIDAHLIIIDTAIVFYHFFLFFEGENHINFYFRLFPIPIGPEIQENASPRVSPSIFVYVFPLWV